MLPFPVPLLRLEAEHSSLTAEHNSLAEQLHWAQQEHKMLLARNALDITRLEIVWVPLYAG